MSNRRSFLQKLGLVSSSILVNKSLLAEEFVLKFKGKSNVPIVLSTWDFGLKANERAWEILSSNGTSLDAVEEGVRITEADPTERSVGYGGRPDRDGIVTLDACIMDHQANIGSVAALENIKHPISVARAVMEKTPHVMLVGMGALQFARRKVLKKKIC